MEPRETRGTMDEARLEFSRNGKMKIDTDGTYILVRNDFYVLDMTGCLKNLA